MRKGGFASQSETGADGDPGEYVEGAAFFGGCCFMHVGGVHRSRTSLAVHRRFIEPLKVRPGNTSCGQGNMLKATRQLSNYSARKGNTLVRRPAYFHTSEWHLHRESP
jgi:hypothetical protein